MCGRGGSTRALDLAHRGSQRIKRTERNGLPSLIAYSLLSGAIATVAGAAVSLAVSGTARVAVWCLVSTATSVAGGLGHGSAWVNACSLTCRRWIQQLADAGATSSRRQ
jgi:hypothetical protein